MMRYTKTILVVSVAIVLTLNGNPLVAQQPFSYDAVVNTAMQSAKQPFEANKNAIPDFLKQINYDQWRDIRFVKEKALWANELSFNVEFFHTGFLYTYPVKINIVEKGSVKQVPFANDLFDYGKNTFGPQVAANTGFAGFRIHYPLVRKDYKDEFAVFLGASYFRAIGQKAVYGLSGRGLAVDTASEKGEEFPEFREFWIVKPAPNDEKITVYALLDSKSMTGAYTFVISPGKETTVDVTVKLFPREDGRKIGIAPLTSMFFYSQVVNQRPVDDFRPQVHDSDGLLIGHKSGQYLWRPLVNLDRLFMNFFSAPDLTGFGLIQRDRNFDHYQDVEAHYEQRPSVWIEPVGSWGAGHVELVQIPTNSEMNDNIVAYWVSDKAIDKNGSDAIKYKMSWYLSGGKKIHELGTVVSSKSSAGKEKNHRKFIIDFKGGLLDKLPAKLPADAPLKPVIAVHSDNREAALTESQLFKLPDGGWRLIFNVKYEESGTIEKILPKNKVNNPIEMAVYLQQAGKALTETWSYAFF